MTSNVLLELTKDFISAFHQEVCLPDQTAKFLQIRGVGEGLKLLPEYRVRTLCYQ